MIRRHNWDVSVNEAIAIQEQLAEEVITQDDLGSIEVVAGIDVGFDEKNRITKAGVVVLSFPELELVDKALHEQPTVFTYIPGLLSFREAPAALEALTKLSIQPDLLICDGQGIAHPRRFGLACHIGLLSGIPSIGAAKSRLIGHHEPLGMAKGSWQPLVDGDEIIGRVLRTRTKVRPVYVSVGQRISLETAADLVLACAPKYRLPETTRKAHQLVTGGW